jgi:hypothetical protein
MSKGLWQGTYAATNWDEYWAEGVQDWFDANMCHPNHDHNNIYTQAQLWHYDPQLVQLLSTVFMRNFKWNGRYLVNR